MYLSIITFKRHAKTVKNAVEKHFPSHQGTKVLALQSHSKLQGFTISPCLEVTENLCLIYTNHIVEILGEETLDLRLHSLKTEIIETLHLEAINSEIWIAISKIPGTTAKADSNKHALSTIVHQWLVQLPPNIQSSLPLSIPQLSDSVSWSYTIYQPLLLLPPPIFKTASWLSVFENVSKSHLQNLYKMICDSMHVTHIAINAPIPPVSSPAGNAGQTEENTLRAPLSLNPLYGDFGAFQPPCLTAFSTAFWVSTRQHGIYQTWAPLYTMFSRGNISEKARILQLPELRAEALGCDSDETCAVDLYAGIGYFSFCYAKAGVGKVLGWELNGWSIEGFRRGAEKNKWSVRVVSPEEEIKEIGEEKLTVFHDNNQNAVKVIEKIRGRIPPVRHVNCGFLPSSKASWSVAVKVLDPQLGGWVHVHENIAEEDIHRRKDEITALLRELVDRAAVGTESVRCQHLQRVKSYAPGIIHCVLDINIPPICD